MFLHITTTVGIFNTWSFLIWILNLAVQMWKAVPYCRTLQLLPATFPKPGISVTQLSCNPIINSTECLWPTAEKTNGTPGNACLIAECTPHSSLPPQLSSEAFVQGGNFGNCGGIYIRQGLFSHRSLWYSGQGYGLCINAQIKCTGLPNSVSYGVWMRLAVKLFVTANNAQPRTGNVR